MIVQESVPNDGWKGLVVKPTFREAIDQYHAWKKDKGLQEKSHRMW